MSLEEQISSVLNDPEAMNKISSIASSLGMSAPESPPQEAPAPQSEPARAAAPQLPSSLTGLRLPDMAGDNRTKLLMALKPFLSKKRAQYVDGAVALMGMMQLGGLGGKDGNPMAPLLSALGRLPENGGGA